ncbi:MAG: MerR family transcriptional regulator [Candidatus Dormibacteraeota bacterium]|nr:MerR family transcriptional regulator [Candidatus Dormibacteraeota bacterium]
MLHVHLDTLRRWEASGLISAVRIGPRGHRRFRPEDLDALIGSAPPGARSAG